MPQPITSNDKLAETVSMLDTIFRRELVSDITTAMIEYGNLCAMEALAKIEVPKTIAELEADPIVLTEDERRHFRTTGDAQ